MCPARVGRLRLDPKRHVPRVTAARDAHPAGWTDPFVSAYAPLAALEVTVGAGAHPGAAVAVQADEDALPVITVKTGIIGGAGHQPAHAWQDPRALPDPVRTGQGAVRVGVVEPVLDVEAAAAPYHPGERARADAGFARVAVECGIVRRHRALRAPALAPINRELALARLVDEVRGQLAHGPRDPLAVSPLELALPRLAARGRGTDHMVRQEATDRPAVCHGRSRVQRGRGERHHQHDADPLDGGLTGLIADAHAATVRPARARVGRGP